MAEKFAPGRCMVVDQNKITVIKDTSSKFDSISDSKIDQRYAQTLSGEDRLEFCKKFIVHPDESIRNEAVWVMQDLIKEYPKGHLIRNHIEMMGQWLLLNDSDAHIRHEACFILIRSDNPELAHVLAYAALRDPAELVRHEATEVLGEMLDKRYFWIIEKNTGDNFNVSF